MTAHSDHLELDFLPIRGQFVTAIELLEITEPGDGPERTVVELVERPIALVADELDSRDMVAPVVELDLALEFPRTDVFGCAVYPLCHLHRSRFDPAEAEQREVAPHGRRHRDAVVVAREV